MLQHQLQVVAMQETGVNWSVVLRENQWRARMESYLDPSQVCAKMCHNTHATTNDEFQWGGTGIMTHGKLKHFAMGAGSDKAKLGRWTWARYRGKGDTVFRMVASTGPTRLLTGYWR